ncbi:MAG TPA: GNAT family protein, partial [Thermomicrobiales bacterium]
SRAMIPLIARWLGDFAVQRTFGGIPRAVTIEEATTIYERWTASKEDYWFAIYERNSGRPIGHTDLFELDWRARTCTFGILIGEADARGKGYGTETASLMLDYAFAALGLHSVMLMTDSYNLAGQAAYRKAGFREFGRRRQCSFLNGQLLDMVYMECLASEFTSPVLSTVFAPDMPR